MNSLQLSPESILPLFDTTKEQRSQFVEQIVAAIEDGQFDPLKIHVQIKAMEDIITGLTSTDEKKNKRNIEFARKYKAIVLDASEKHGKSFQIHNSGFKITETGVKYNYSDCNDSIINDLYAEMESLKAAISERELFLKNAPISGVMIVDQETGETTTIYPPSKTSTTSVTITLK